MNDPLNASHQQSLDRMAKGSVDYLGEVNEGVKVPSSSWTEPVQRL